MNIRTRHRIVDWLLIALALSPLLIFGAQLAHGDETQIPSYSVRYRAALEHEAARRFGIDAPVAMLAAQIQAESNWNPKAHSIYAQGLAQFIPSTAQWLPDICPDIGAPDPWDAQWSLRAIACYDFYLYTPIHATTVCDRWAFTLSDYNGGTRARVREQALAKNAGRDPARWFSGTESYSSRTSASFTENRGYVRKILLVYEPAYVEAGWPGSGDCL